MGYTKMVLVSLCFVDDDAAFFPLSRSLSLLLSRSYSKLSVRCCRFLSFGFGFRIQES